MSGETAEQKRARYYQRRDAGLCVRCGRPADGSSLCDKHWQRQTAATQARRAAAAPAPIEVVEAPRCVTIVEVRSTWTVGNGLVVRRG